jgi:hypothetical protein
MLCDCGNELGLVLTSMNGEMALLHCSACDIDVIMDVDSDGELRPPKLRKQEVRGRTL